jgi:sentrin-specific protease 7
LQAFQQGGSHRTLAGQQHSRPIDATKSHHFPNARINESTVAQTMSNRPVASDSTNLRNSHRSVLKQADAAADNYSADELAPSPDSKQTTPLSKAVRAANSGIKRKAPGKSEGIGWPLLFARSHDYGRRVQRLNVNAPELMLRFGLNGWVVKAVDEEGNLESKIDLQSQFVNKAQADDVSRIRLEGPRRKDGNIHIFDLEFARPNDFLKFRNEFLTTTLLINEKLYSREEYGVQTTFTDRMLTIEQKCHAQTLRQTFTEAQQPSGPTRTG